MTHFLNFEYRTVLKSIHKNNHNVRNNKPHSLIAKMHFAIIASDQTNTEIP